MVPPMRMTKGIAASILFGLGSFTLMADITVVVITNGDEGGNFFDMGFPTPLGIAGLILWVIGIILLLFHRTSKSKQKKDSIRPIFLKGRLSIPCPGCGTRIDTSKIDFHLRYHCPCGQVMDLYQEKDEFPDRT